LLKGCQHIIFSIYTVFGWHGHLGRAFTGWKPVPRLGL
jgi:hypothetical protein